MIFQVFTAANTKMIVFWAIALMMEAASTFEMSVNFYQTTRRNIPDDSHLHTRRRENLKSHLVNLYGEAALYCVRRLKALRLKDLSP
jgi:hypothetical protein